MQTSNAVLLTYKGRILLVSKDENVDDITKNVWAFIDGEKKGDESPEDALYRAIKHVTKLNVKYLKLSPLDKDANLYHIKLTDDLVNHIERSDKQRLEFFKLPEIERLIVTELTKSFIDLHKLEIQKILSY